MYCSVLEKSFCINTEMQDVQTIPGEGLRGEEKDSLDIVTLPS